MILKNNFAAATGTHLRRQRCAAMADDTDAVVDQIGAMIGTVPVPKIAQTFRRS